MQLAGSSRSAESAALIGNTPLLRMASVEPGNGARIYGKAEWFNPGGSVKDRAALAMVRDAEWRGVLTPGKTILESSSGNTGISLAMIGAALGYPVKVFMSEAASLERRRLIESYGAELVLTDGALGSDGAMLACRRRWLQCKDVYAYMDQYANAANWKAHAETTGPEIERQTRGRVTHFVAGIGTGGTFTGVARYLRGAISGGVWNIAVEMESAQDRIPGLRHLPSQHVPAVYQAQLAHATERVTAADARRMVEQVAITEGVLLGPSGGAALVAARRVAESEPGAFVVAILPDSGERYLSHAG